MNRIQIEIAVIGVDRAASKLRQMAEDAAKLAVSIERTRMVTRLLKLGIPLKLAEWFADMWPEKWYRRAAFRRVIAYLKRPPRRPIL